MTANETRRPANIIHVVEDMKIGGMERIIASLVTGLDPRKYATQVLCLARGGQIADELKRKGVPVTILELENYHSPRQLWSLYRWLREKDFIILHAHGYFAGVFARVAGLLSGIPILINHVHSNYIDYHRRHLVMEKILSSVTDRTLCISEAVEKWLIESVNVSKSKTMVVYNGVDPISPLKGLQKTKDEFRHDMLISPRDTVFIIIASLVPNKGHHILLRAFKRVLMSHPEASLLIVGGGPLDVDLSHEARALPQGKVIFTGLQPDVAPFIIASDALVLPSLFREGLGIALLEGMSAGLAMIGSRLGGIAEVIEDGVNGMLVQPGNEEDLSRALIWMIEHPDERIEMGKRGKEKWAREFSKEKMIARISLLYENLISHLCARKIS